MAQPNAEDIKNLSRYFAIEANNEFWRLSEKELSNKEQKDILAAAFTSLYHWQQVGNDDNKYLAFLAVARALTINNIADLAVEYASHCFEFFKESEENWIKAFANAILSHALLLQGNTEKASFHYNIAKSIGNKLQPEDKEIFDATFVLVPDPT